LVYVTLGIAVGVRVAGTDDSVSSVVALSALPVVGLSILARTPAGLQLQAGLASSKPQREADKASTKAARAAARARLPSMYGPTRSVLVSSPPSHLDGSLPGDLGVDPLALGVGRLGAMRTYELLHARWAMLGAVGALFPEALSRAGVQLGESVWWRVGGAKLAGETIDWGGVSGFHIAGAQGVAVIAACQLVLMGGPEYARYVGIDSLEPVGIPLPGDADYPGGAPFDPLGLARDANVFEQQRGYELHVGRAAMVAFAGFVAQAAATGAGPLENLLGPRL
jgi:light-harvesting complex II chlorophyll a/b binding protein 7